MLVVLRAKATWPDRTSLEGEVTFDYLSQVDPWLVHLTFKVAGTTEDHDIERLALVQAVTSMGTANEWFGPDGAPLRIFRAKGLVRLRVADAKANTWVDFDLDWHEVRKVMVLMDNLCDVSSEQKALAAHIDEALEKFDE